MNVKNILTITKKEFNASFASPIAYIVICLFLATAGTLFFLNFFRVGAVSLREYFTWLPVLFMIFVPAITMRLFSEEMSTGSYELLITLPVTTLDVVLGKLFSSFAFVLAMVVPTFIYSFFVAAQGDLEWGVTIGGYLGAIILGFAYTAIALLCSALSKSQVVALLMALFFCFVFTFLNIFANFLPNMFQGFFRFFSAHYHFQSISRGVVDFRDILYFVSIIFITTYLTFIVMKERTN